ncbi:MULTISPECIES: hypothetical protein [Cysteiniphilum]|uniref:hypothetical protein n=1 Tax=Cysteiniphilum TaxID=2056696 RepID=UPI00177D1344|nr:MULTISPECIES: hypothetical protein [Cysteiniphilum]
MDTNQYRKSTRMLLITEAIENGNISDVINGKYCKPRSDIVSVVSRVADTDSLNFKGERK